MSLRRLPFAVLLLAIAAPPLLAQGSGVLTGVVTRDDGPLGGVSVVVNEVSRAELTDVNGRYRIADLPAGTYTVTFSLSDHLATVSDVAVAAGAVTELDREVDWDVSFAETITVYSASRRRERVVEAPAAVTVVSEDEIEREAAHGQLAKVLEFTPGAELTQSGLYDFNLNTRGFNSSLNRRVPSLIDGRDPSVAFLGSQDWAALSSMGDIASMELIRGPSSALYGTNAFNGILNLTTKQPRYSQGGLVQLTAGELSTLRGDVRWAGQLGANTYLKALGSYTQSDDFYQSRTVATGVEYGACTPGSRAFGCLPFEPIPLATEEDELTVANARLDHYFGTTFLSVEGGTSSVEGPLIQTGIGRVQVLEADSPYARVNLSGERFNVLSYYNRRDAPVQTALASGANLFLDSTVWHVELQGNLPFHQDRGRVVAGASYRDETIDTRRTLTLTDEVGGERQAVYSQLEYAFSPRLRAVVAGRYDDSSLHEDRFSPKAALVFAPTANQTLRLTYNEAFQSPNYSEFFLAAPAAQPLNLSPVISAIERAAGLPAGALSGLGFGFVPVLARGNEALALEEISTWEVGYSGILGGKLFLTADYYQSELENFVTDLIPGVNPAFPRYSSAAIPPALNQAIVNTLIGLNPLLVGITNLGGQPAVILSYTNAGSAESQGADLGATWYLSRAWNLNFAYSWFDWEAKAIQAGDRLLPNAPENQASFGVSYVGDRVDGSLGYRWVDDFDWAAGVFFGPIPQYETVNLTANYRMTDHLRLGLNVSNLLDSDHWEAFGGDRLGRRALGTVTFTW